MVRVITATTVQKAAEEINDFMRSFASATESTVVCKHLNEEEINLLRWCNFNPHLVIV